MLFNIYNSKNNNNNYCKRIIIKYKNEKNKNIFF